jgi:hypothetical protein
MPISVNDVMQTALLRNTTALNSVSGNGSTAFNSALMEALSDGDNEGDGNQSLLPGANSTYALLSCLMNSGLCNSSNMMLLSLCSALYGDGSTSLLGVTNPYVNTASAYDGRVNGGIPANPSIPAQPAVTSNVNNRSSALYSSVINQFNVETNARYQPDGGTYCNIFVWDVTSAMDAEIPHYYNAKTGEPMSCGDPGANQMNANGMYKWLHEFGGQYGWTEVTPEKAQELANGGHPVVTALYRNGQHGHVQVVCPSENGTYDAERGVTIAQAGRRLTSYRPITKIYNSSLPNVSYFAHV